MQWIRQSVGRFGQLRNTRNTRTARLTVGLVAAGAAFFGGLAMVVAQGNPQSEGLPALSATPPHAARLKADALGGAVFEPLVTFHAPAIPAQKGPSSSSPAAVSAVSLCMTLSGHPPIAVFSLGTAYESKFEQESLVGRKIQTIGGGWVRFDDGTMLVESNCVGSASAAGAPTPPTTSLSGGLSPSSDVNPPFGPGGIPTPAPGLPAGGWRMQTPPLSPPPAPEATP